MEPEPNRTVKYGSGPVLNRTATTLPHIYADHDVICCLPWTQFKMKALTTQTNRQNVRGRAPIEPEPSLARAAFSSARIFRAEPSRARAGGTARLGFFEPSRAGSNFFYSHVRSSTFLVRTLENISLCHTHFLVQDVIGISTNNGALRY